MKQTASLIWVWAVIAMVICSLPWLIKLPSKSEPEKKGLNQELEFWHGVTEGLKISKSLRDGTIKSVEESSFTNLWHQHTNSPHNLFYTQ